MDIEKEVQAVSKAMKAADVSVEEFKRAMERFPRNLSTAVPTAVATSSGGVAWNTYPTVTVSQPKPKDQMEKFLKLVEKRAGNPNISTDELRAEIGEYLTEITNRLSAALRARED